MISFDTPKRTGVCDILIIDSIIYDSDRIEESMDKYGISNYCKRDGNSFKHTKDGFSFDEAIKVVQVLTLCDHVSGLLESGNYESDMTLSGEAVIRVTK